MQTINIGLKVGDGIPKDIVENGNAAIGNWIHSRYDGFFGCQEGSGPDLLDISTEIKSKAIDSANTPWTIGSLTTSDLLGLPLDNTPLLSKLQRILIIRYCKDDRTIKKVDLVDLSHSEIQKEICKYADDARVDLFSQLNKGIVKPFQKAGSCDINFERRNATEQWSLRISQPKMRKLISKSNMLNNPCFI